MDKPLALTPLRMSKLKHLLLVLGPGILFAGAAVGGSHLVQSTRAGALFGFTLLPLVLLINLLKYPFFEFAQRYTVITNNNILQGYYKLHPKALGLFFLISAISSFITIAAVSFIAASILAYIFHISSHIALSIILISSICLLLLGSFGLLDKFIKTLMLILTIAVIIAAMLSMKHASSQLKLTSFDGLWTLSGFTFMIALMGWMPAPLDGAAWTSLWLQQRISHTKYHPNLKEVLFDFRFGYCLTTLLALLFLTLGAMMMFRARITFSANGILFSEQLIDLFGLTLGQWSEIIVSIAALATMVSTTVTCLDAYPRVLTKSTVLLFKRSGRFEGYLYWFFLILFGFSTFITINFFQSNLKRLIDVATILAFLSAPFIGWLNIKLIRQAKELYPGRTLMSLAIIGLIFLTCISLAFIIIKVVT
jgi:Mn2+/Fe2+ NRAMP family transporter